jgi:hypothetical protein
MVVSKRNVLITQIHEKDSNDFKRIENRFLEIG